MSEMYFVSNLVARLPIVTTMGKENELAQINTLFKTDFKDIESALDEGLSKYDIPLELVRVENEWIARMITEKTEDSGMSYISLARILEFKSMVENIIGMELSNNSISVQSYGWYNCSEEPIR